LAGKFPTPDKAPWFSSNGNRLKIGGDRVKDEHVGTEVKTKVMVFLNILEKLY